MARSAVTAGGIRTFAVGELWQACSEYEHVAGDLERARYLRDSAIRRARAAGMSLVEVAEVVGISKARVQQISPGTDKETLDLDDQQAVG